MVNKIGAAVTFFMILFIIGLILIFSGIRSLETGHTNGLNTYYAGIGLIGVCIVALIASVIYGGLRG